MASIGGIDPNVRLQTSVELYLSARGLPKMDVLSQSDPFAVLSMKAAGGAWTRLAQTETVQDADQGNCNWTTQIVVEFMFEQVQEFKVDVYDEDSQGRDGAAHEDLSRHDFIGSAQFTLSSLMGARGQSLAIQLRSPAAAAVGTLVIKGDELSACNDLLHIRFGAEHLDACDGFLINRSSDPFIEIKRVREDSSTVSVFRCQPIMRNLNPVWPEFTLPMATLGGSVDNALIIEVWDWDSDGTHDYIGNTEVNVRTLLEMSGTASKLPLINQDKQRKKGRKYKNSGELRVVNATYIRRGSLLEYVRGGLQISLAVAIDFTASNGDPSTPGTLHYRDPARFNAYQAALCAVGSVLLDYDSDKMVAMLGYGGVPISVGSVQHSFSMTFTDNPHVPGVQGMLDAYNNALTQVRLSGPTLFTPVINTVAAAAAAEHVSQENQNYTVLLLITDGAQHDQRETIDALVAASGTLPLSLIIVGVGDADFSAMEVLDGDDADEGGAGKLRSERTGQYAARDIVQFVPFNQFAGNPGALAAEVLRELPEQIVEFFTLRGIVPNPPIPPQEPQLAQPVVAQAEPVAAAAPAPAATVPVAQAAPVAVPVASAPPAQPH